MITDAIVSRVASGATVLLVLALVSTCAVDDAKIRNRDKEISVLTDRIERPATGYIAMLGSCGAQKTQLQSEIDATNERVAELWAEGEKSTRAAQAAVDAAQRAQASAERRAALVQAQQPQPGESRCDAAVRVIQESVQ